MMQLTEGGSLYDRIGPEALRTLLERFYGHVSQDPHLAPIFPGSRDPALWAVTLEKQFAFMTGFLGGPPLYHRCTTSATATRCCVPATCPSRSRRPAPAPGWRA